MYSPFVIFFFFCFGICYLAENFCLTESSTYTSGEPPTEHLLLNEWAVLYVFIVLRRPEENEWLWQFSSLDGMVLQWILQFSRDGKREILFYRYLLIFFSSSPKMLTFSSCAKQRANVDLIFEPAPFLVSSAFLSYFHWTFCCFFPLHREISHCSTTNSFSTGKWMHARKSLLSMSKTTHRGVKTELHWSSTLPYIDAKKWKITLQMYCMGLSIQYYQH